LGIFTSEETQIVFLDTPGILKPKYELQRNMAGYIKEALETCDAVSFIMDVTKREPASIFATTDLYHYLKNTGKPAILLINKIDLLPDVKLVLPVIKEYYDLGVFKDVFPLSAIKGTSVQDYLKTISDMMPEGPFFYDPEMIGTQPERFFVSEIIREKIFNELYQELPYSTEVQIVEYKERQEGKYYISADIIIERHSQKTIMVGENGSMIKHIGQLARQDIEEHLQQEVYLELFVKVRENWRNNKNFLKSYGY
jgi:GTP-binding protein Era